jgi:hypothetical protein
VPLLPDIPRRFTKLINGGVDLPQSNLCAAVIIDKLDLHLAVRTEDSSL